MNHTRIAVEATIDADIDKIWNYYTEPEHITQWNFASDDWYCPSAENDLRPGGRYTARMEAKDGSYGFDFEAIYDDIIHHKEISYTMTDGRQATATFEKLNGSTKVTVSFDAEETNPAEMQQQGWQAILNNFKKYSESR